MKRLTDSAMSRSFVSIIIAIIGILYFLTWSHLSLRFSTGDHSDYYQYVFPFKFQTQFLDIRFPLIGSTPPFSESWGIQWPFHMIIKSGFFTVFPYSYTSAFLLSSAILVLGSIVTYRSVIDLTGNQLIAFTAGIAALLDRTLLNLSLSGRPEGLACLLLILLIGQAAKIHKSIDQTPKVGFLIPFFLLPGVHHIGFMVITGIVVIHVAFFKSLFPRGHIYLRWLPLICYSFGICLFLAWFTFQPAALEQMRINLGVQNEIYESATRFTYFQNFIANAPLFGGYLSYGLPLALSFFIAFRFAKRLLIKPQHPGISPDLVFAGAIVMAMPIIGYLFQVDNFFHFSISSFPAIYLVASLCNSSHSRLSSAFVIVTLALICATSSTYTLWKCYAFHTSGYPNFSKERSDILSSHKSPGKYLIPTDFIHEIPSDWKEKCFFYTFPIPINPEIRRTYEDKILSQSSVGDLLIVHSDPTTLSDRLLKRPIRDFNALPSEEWELIDRKIKNLRGRTTSWGWDYSIYRRK